MRLRAGGMLLLVGSLLLAGAGRAEAQDLATCVELALARVPGLAADKARALAAEQGIGVAFAGYLPRLDLSLSGHYGWRDEPTISDRFATHYLEGEARLELRQRLFDGGVTAYGVDAASYEAEAARHVAENAAESLAAEVAMAYLDAYAGEQSVAIAAASLSDLRRLAGLIQQQTAAGLLTPADQAQLEGRVALAAADLAEAEGRRQVAAARLEALTGEPIALLVLPALPSDRLPANPSLALERALLGSPWLAEAAAESRARLVQQAQAYARYWPALDLVIAGRATENLDGIEGQGAEALILLELRWTLLDGFGREAEARRLGALGASAHDEMLDRRRRLQGRIDRAFAQMSEGTARLAALEPAVAASRDTWRLYRDQFAIGRRSLIELLDARLDLERAEQRRLTALLLAPRAAFDLGAALGELRLWLVPQAVEGLPVDAVASLPRELVLAAGTTTAPPVNVATGRLLASLGSDDLPAVSGEPPVEIQPPVAGKLGAGPDLATLSAALLQAAATLDAKTLLQPGVAYATQRETAD